MVVHRDWGGAPEPLCPSPGGTHGAGTAGGSEPGAAAPAGSPGSALGLLLPWGAIPALLLLPLSAWTAPPQHCLPPRGLDVPGGSLGTNVGSAGTRFWDFLSFLKTLSFCCSFGRLDSLQTSLQLLFVTDFTPSIAFLLLEAEASWLETFPHRGCVQWISLGFSSGNAAALTSSLREGLSTSPPGDSRESRAKDGSRDRP